MRLLSLKGKKFVKDFLRRVNHFEKWLKRVMLEGSQSGGVTLLPG
jgi:hypothetical protein